MMKMRRTWGMLLMAASLLFTACQQDEVQAPEDTQFAAAEFELPDLSDLETPEVTMGTDNGVLTCTPRETSREKMELLRRALKNLNLNENQLIAVKRFAQQHHACVAEHLTQIQNLHQELLRRANATRENHLAAYRAGQITKAQLEEKLAALRAAVKEEMAKHETKQIHMRMLRRCRLELLQKIESILNPAQLQKWNTWKAQLA
ncbi:hypothetical protein [Nibribacter koreensis]|uniref:Lipoprotein n=1 Tax=Nibribacter koreensis TaxID=1084519 RepID=A0ABP8FD60_9BACT